MKNAISIPARIHLLPAKDAPYVVILRRKPSKCFRVIRWNTIRDTLEHGSRFQGKLYPKRCDVSYDGDWMVYLAMGSSGQTWNGICRLPYLRTVAEGTNMGTWYGGGVWTNPNRLSLNGWQPENGRVPFTLEQLKPEYGGEDLSVLYAKWQRDGWQRRGPNFGTFRKLTDTAKYTVVCEGDNGWVHQPTRQHPPLVARNLGYLEHGYTFQFTLEGHEDLLDDQVDSACWDYRGNLVYSRQGIVYKYSLANLSTGYPGSVHDLESLTPKPD
ncbi:hypothetical protein [Blastopirellula marina]|nr:hypothetical protein [Blastopirellula marina]